MIYLTLFFEFFKIGLFAIGGGAVVIPFLMDLSERLSWFSASELANIIAIAESTPGPIGVNAATYCGYNTAGIPGALIATFGLALPSFLVIVLIAEVMLKYRKTKFLDSVFYGIRPTVAGLIFCALWSFLKVSIFTAKEESLRFLPIHFVIFALLFAAMSIKKISGLHPLVWIGAGALIGIVLKL